MVLVALSVGVIFAYSTYQAVFKEKKTDLINIAKSRARVIESVAQFDLEQMKGASRYLTTSDIH